MQFKQSKLAKSKRVKKIKAAVEKYKGGIKLMEKKLMSAVRSYKEAVEEERIEMATKRIAKSK